MKTKQDKLNLIDETIEFYKTHERCVRVDPQGMDTIACSYYLQDRPHGCAVGRLFNSVEERRAFQERLSNDTSIDVQSVSSNKIFDLLPEYIQEWGQNFLSHLQSMHDNKEWIHESIVEEFKQKVLQDKI